MPNRSIIILGTNGNCMDIAEAIAELQRNGEAIECQGFLDDDPARHGQELAGRPVLGSLVDAARFPSACFINGIGSQHSYRRKATIIASTGIQPESWSTIVHPSASVSPSARLGRGTVVLSNVSIGAGVELGDHVMVLQNAVISHDTKVGPYSVIATGVCLSGLVTTGENCYLGSNCSIRQNIRVGDGALVGMGAVVVKDVPAYTTVVGNPARVLQK